MHKQSILLGISIALSCYFFATCSDVCVKWLSSGYSPYQIIFLRSFISLLVILPILYVRNDLRLIKTYKPHLHISRAIVSFTGVFIAVFALQKITITEYTAIFFTTPFFVLLLSWYFLGEHIGLHKILATIVAFIGAMIIISPDSAGISWGGLLTLISTFCVSVIIVQTRVMSWSEPSVSSTFWLMVLNALFAFVFMPFVWVTPDLFDFTIFFLCGIATSMLNITMAEALKYAPASVISPFVYTGFIWAAFFGYFIWGDIPTETKLYGTAIIVFAGLYLSYEERRQERKK